MRNFLVIDSIIERHIVSVLRNLNLKKKSHVIYVSRCIWNFYAVLNEHYCAKSFAHIFAYLRTPYYAKNIKF